MNLRRCAWWCGLLLGLAARADAAWHSALRMSPDCGVDIELASPVDHPARDGYTQCWVTISNHSGEAHTWTIRTNAGSGMGGSPNQANSSQSLRVEGDATARLSVLMPMAPSTGPSFGYYRSSVVEVEGYGVEETSAGLPSAGSTGKPPTAVIGLGGTLAVPLWEPLKKAYDDRGAELAGSPVEVALLGSDWRGLSGFDALCLTETEYAGLDASRQAAIREWIEQGGKFYLCTRSLDPAWRAGLGLAGADTESHPGYGQVKLLPEDGRPLSIETATALIDGVRSLRKDESVTNATDWVMARDLGAIPVNATFLIGFIVVFAVLVGPVNLFWLANSTRRHRLFWTTPLISLAASLLLLVVIVFQDGFGGRGERVMVTLLCPDQRQAVVVQEQVVRTGVLLARNFTAAEDLVLTPLKAGRFSGASFDQSGRSYGGDWFASRTVQAQRAEAIVPSRAEIQLLNGDAANAGAPPILVSSIPAALTEIRYVTPAGVHWRGGILRTGEHITLQPDPAPGGYDDAWGSTLTSAWQHQVHDRPGCFYARADEAPFIATLPSIRWHKQRATFLGPVTLAAH